MSRARDEYRHQDSQPRVVISQPRKVRSVELKQKRIFFALVAQGSGKEVSVL